MKAIPKLVFYLIFIGIIFNGIKTYYYQNNLEFILYEEVFGWPFKLAFYGNVMISLASVISFLLYRKYFPGYVTFCYVGLIILVTIASWTDLGELIKTPTALYTTKGLGTFVNMGLVFFAANTVDLKKVLKIFYYMCFIFLISGMINLSKVGFGSERLQYLYAIRDYTVYLIWVFPFFLLQDQPSQKVNTLNIIVFLLIFIFVLSTGSRTYIVIYGLFFLAKFKKQLQGKNVVLGVAGGVVLVAAAFFILSNTGFNKTIEGAFNILSERSKDDSRSDQLAEFLSQYDLKYLIQGVGPIKMWYWSSVGPYPFLDNQFLLLSWWAGLPTVLLYFFYLIKNFFKKTEILYYENIHGIRIILGLWILACLGFAIYVTISSDLFYYFISLLTGLYVCNFSKLYTADIEET